MLLQRKATKIVEENYGQVTRAYINRLFEQTSFQINSGKAKLAEVLPTVEKMVRLSTQVFTEADQEFQRLPLLNMLCDLQAKL